MEESTEGNLPSPPTGCYNNDSSDLDDMADDLSDDSSGGLSPSLHGPGDRVEGIEPPHYRSSGRSPWSRQGNGETLFEKIDCNNYVVFLLHVSEQVEC